jgi:hypothetical protein
VRDGDESLERMKRLAHDLTLCAAASLVLALSLGCGGPRSRLLDDGRYVPKSWETAPIQSPGQAAATRPLRYDLIYVIEPFSSPTEFGATFDPARWNMDYYRCIGAQLVGFVSGPDDDPDILLSALLAPT